MTARHASPGTRASADRRVRSRRNPALDGLRAVAVGGVVYRHLGLPGLSGGGVGVFAFFVLSGFLITLLLCRECERTGGIALGAFWVRRVRRLVPALVATVVFTLVLAWAVGADVGRTALQSLPALGYFANWWRVWEAVHPGTVGLGPFEHTWSLSVEEQFYLTWPLLFLLLYRLLRANPVAMAVAMLVLAEASAAVRYLTWDDADPARSAAVVYNRLDGEAELLLVGAAAGVLAWWLGRRELAPRTAARIRVAGVVGLIGLAASFWLQPGPEYPNRMHLFWTTGLTAIAFVTAASCLYLTLQPHTAAARVLGHPVPAAIGRISYGIYLYHFPLVTLLLPELPVGAVGRLVVVVVTLVVSVLSWRFLELPIIQAGRRARRSPRAQAARRRREQQAAQQRRPVLVDR